MDKEDKEEETDKKDVSDVQQMIICVKELKNYFENGRSRKVFSFCIQSNFWSASNCVKILGQCKVLLEKNPSLKLPVND